MAVGQRAQQQLAVETELASAEARIFQLQRELFDIRQRLNGTMPILYMLPEDIIVEIFQYVLPGFPNNPELTGYGCVGKPVQFTLGAVCRTWRNIVWRFPGLWKDLRFTFSSDPVRTEVHVDLIQEWIHRTGQLPLHISLSMQTTRNKVLDRILRLLLRECRRWRCLQVAGRGTHRLRKEMSEGDFFFPMLDSLFLGADSHKVSSTVDLPYQWTFKTELSLRHLTLGKGTWWKNKTIGLEWPTIRDLYFVGEEGAGLTIMSEMAESLLFARVVFFPVEDGDEMPYVRLPALRELVIGDDEYPELIVATCPITVLETPALQRLRLYLEPQATQLSFLSTMLVRSQCSLIDLSLDNLHTSMDSLIEFLRVVPSLRTFSFDLVGECVLMDEFVDAMNPPDTETSAHGRCLPNISKIIYQGRISFKPQKVIDMLRSRLGTQQDQAPTDTQIETFSILCKNPDWASSTKQNILRTFYQDIWALKSIGTTFDIVYDEGDDVEVDGKA
ncbi:hypothetical protein CPB83DRAFT_501599 [Crepidotus variabilis]|uniref:F-box domain-containing protein n=1 Tax=Crepidotus variabilis TaxID=179855 RepID=A0A9P6JMI6_9AGAR|nr:hypothetical protein CPB83DRAFT_501599 [Crepidotus variabilis]